MDGRYIVGVDDSAPSRAATVWAVHHAARTGRDVVFVRVTSSDDAPGSDVNASLLAESRAIAAAAGVHAESREVSGPLAWTLAEVSHGDDVVVVGTHKTGFLHGRVLGSRSVQIALAVPGSVAVVPDIDLRFRRGVVAGIDRVDTAVDIATLAADEAMSRHEELTLLQSVPRADRARDELAIALAAHEVAARFPGLVIRSRVSTRPPAEALLDAARDKALLVLGPGSLESTRSPLGSVVHDVLLNVTAPVWVTRPALARSAVLSTSSGAASPGEAERR